MGLQDYTLTDYALTTIYASNPAKSVGTQRGLIRRVRAIFGKKIYLRRNALRHGVWCASFFAVCSVLLVTRTIVAQDFPPDAPTGPGVGPPGIPGEMHPGGPANRRPFPRHPSMGAPLAKAAAADDQQPGKEAEGKLISSEGTDASAGGETEINVKNADLEAVIRIFSKKTKRNFLLDEKVKGKISIFLPGKISSDESIRILDAVLAMKGFTAVPIADNLWKIVPSKEARQTTIPTLTESSDGKPSASVVTRLLRLRYVNAEDIKQFVTQLVSSDGLVSSYAGTNALILIDQEDNIARITGIIETLDVPFSDREMTIIPIKHAAAKDLAERLKEILGEGEKKNSSEGGGQSGLDLIRARFAEASARMMSNTPGNAAGASGGQALGNQSGGSPSGQNVPARAREPKIIPDERTNAIIVVADEDTTTRIRALISQLDSKIDLSGVRFYVYRCQHAKASELAAVLSGSAGGTGSGSGASTGTRSGFDSEGGRESNGGSFGTAGRGSSSSLGSSLSRGGSRGLGSSLDSARSRTGSSGGAAGASSVSLGENVSVTADPATNSLIIRAGHDDFLKILDLLKKLDIKRRQVLVEAMLLEVGIQDDQTNNFSFLTSTGGKDGGVIAKSDFGGQLNSILTDPRQVSDFAVAAASAGTISLPGGIQIPTQSVLLNAAKRNSNVNVLSAPTILATDNEEAQIVVGQNVPFISNTSSNETNLNNTFNQVERQDVGIKLRITPQISSRNFVSLKLFTEVSNVVPDTANSRVGPTTTIRTSETSVITKDSQMVVIGGLMSDDITESDAGIPFLKDIPVLGHAFKSSGESRRRTNLLIFITPRIVNDQFDAREITITKRDALRSAMDEFDVYPRRNEVMENPDIDRVSEHPTAGGVEEVSGGEGEEQSSARPKGSEGTILGPRSTSAALHDGARLNGRAVAGADQEEINSGGVLDLEATAPLPSNLPKGSFLTPGLGEPLDDTRQRNRESAPEANRHSATKDSATIAARSPGKGQHGEPPTAFEPRDSSPGAAAPRAKFVPGSLHRSSATTSQARAPSRVLVFRVRGATHATEGLPFKVDKPSGLFAIALPDDDDARAEAFFARGKEFEYALGDAHVPASLQGRFSTLNEARSKYPSLPPESYTLSPHELMGLGKTSWRVRG